jgi:hypothetical protein
VDALSEVDFLHSSEMDKPNMIERLKSGCIRKDAGIPDDKY